MLSSIAATVLIALTFAAASYLLAEWLAAVLIGSARHERGERVLSPLSDLEQWPGRISWADGTRPEDYRS
jgi:hypothetical protein